jgi:tetratricopeptide (TPR) repeat protein
VKSAPAITDRNVRTRSVYGGVAAIVIAVVLVWSNSFSAPFLLDDYESIVSNTTIRDLLSLGWLKPPAEIGETVSGRPVLNFSFALNHVLGGLDVRGYRAVNVLLHVISACILFALVRRTLARSNTDKIAAPLALAIALIWALHPLQTSAVTYVVQRAESLAGLFALLTLYGFVRGAAVPNGRRWFAVSCAASLLGIGTKETAVVAPLVVLLYDRAFMAGSFRAAFRVRSRYYMLLAATWLPLLALVWKNTGRGGSAGFAAAIEPWTYFATQCEAIVRYLGLAFWPAFQVFDYGVPTVEGLREVLPEFLLLCSLAAGVIWALWRNRPIGFLGACFFLALAPSSSVVPVATQTMAEHRMYLALAPLIVAVSLAIEKLFKAPNALRAWRLSTVLAIAVIVALGITTFARNQVYRSELALWEDTVAKRPENPRAQNNLGSALRSAGRTDEAKAAFRRAIELQPNHAFAQFNWGTMLLSERRWDEAAARFRDAIAGDPNYLDAHINLGRALGEMGRIDEAMAEYRIALQIDPRAQDARTNLAALLIKQGQFDAGEAMLRDVLAEAPNLAEVHYHLGLARQRSGKIDEAEAELREALRLKPELAVAHVALGNILVRRREISSAEASYREAIRRDPELAEAHFALGNVFVKGQKMTEAMDAYREALALEPSHIQARNNLANSQLMTGQLAEAIENYQASLRLRPDDSAVRQNLDIARELLRRKTSEAR